MVSLFGSVLTDDLAEFLEEIRMMLWDSLHHAVCLGIISEKEFDVWGMGDGDQKEFQSSYTGDLDTLRIRGVLCIGGCIFVHAIEQSGLWNINHVAEDYQPEFLEVLEGYINRIPGFD
jgi:hypothetical protein